MVPSRTGASGSHHLPWALSRILQSIPKIKRLAGGSDWPPGRACGAVCLKDASNAFIPGKHASAIAASAAGRQRGSGPAGRPSRRTGRRWRANRNATAKAVITESGSEAGNHQNQKRLARPRG